MGEKEKDPKELTDKDFQNKFGLMMSNISDLSDQQELIPTGIYGIDYITGGMWKGHLFVIEGPERSSKSTLVYCIIQKLISKYNFNVCLIDAEGSLDETFMSNIGLLESKNFKIAHIEGSGEKALQGIHQLILSGKFDVVAIDSFAALVPEKLTESDAAGQYARMLSKYLSAISQAALATKTIILGVNQIRTDLSGFHPRTIPTGGNSLRHFSATRLSLSAKEMNQFFQYSLAKCHKSKNHIPNREITLKIFYGKNLDEGYDRVEVGILIKEIKELGGWLEYKGKKYRRSELEVLLAHEDPMWSLDTLSKESAPIEEMFPSQMLPFSESKETVQKESESSDDSEKKKTKREK